MISCYITKHPKTQWLEATTILLYLKILTRLSWAVLILVRCLGLHFSGGLTGLKHLRWLAHKAGNRCWKSARSTTGTAHEGTSVFLHGLSWDSCWTPRRSVVRGKKWKLHVLLKPEFRSLRTSLLSQPVVQSSCRSNKSQEKKKQVLPPNRGVAAKKGVDDSCD